MPGWTGIGGNYVMGIKDKEIIYVKPTNPVEGACPFYNKGECVGMIKEYCMNGTHEGYECYQQKMGAQTALEENSKLVKEVREQ